jgi:hypothetical protein
LITRADAADTEMLASKEDATRTAGAFVLVSVCTVRLLGVGSRSVSPEIAPAD